MKTQFLLPRKFHLIGWILLLVFAPLGIACLFWEFSLPFLEMDLRTDTDILTSEKEDFTNELAALGTLTGFLFISLASVKGEDEFIQSLRLNAYQKMLVLYSILLVIQMLSFYSLDFIFALSFNMYFPFLIYYIFFRASLYQSRKASGHEE